jgi:hypothetical protein
LMLRQPSAAVAGGVDPGRTQPTSAPTSAGSSALS